MPSHRLGLVTIFHPNVFLGCDAPELRDLPHATRMRAVRTGNVERAGLPISVQYIGKRSVMGNGKEVIAHRDTWISGDRIVGFLAEPRLICIPDEQSRRPRWRLEFRRNWPEEDPPLGQAPRDLLFSAIASSWMTVKGLWINPNIDPTRDNPEWVNLVLAPCSTEALPSLRKSSLVLARDAEAVTYISW